MSLQRDCQQHRKVCECVSVCGCVQLPLAVGVPEGSLGWGFDAWQGIVPFGSFGFAHGNVRCHWGRFKI